MFPIFCVGSIKASYDVEKIEKRCFLYDWRQVINLLQQCHAMWRKLNLFCTCFNSSEGQENCDSLAKNNFVRITFQKFGAVCDHMRKNTEASGNWSIIYLKSKHSHEHCIYNKSWLNNKTEKVWHLFVSPFIFCCCWCFMQLSSFDVAMLIRMDFQSVTHAKYI